MKRKIFIVLSMMLLVLSLASCGKKEVKKYIVKYYDSDLISIIYQIEVEEGQSVQNDQLLNIEPSKKGYRFIGWDKNATDVKSNLDIYPLFEKVEEIPYFEMYIDTNDNLRIINVIVSALESTNESEYKKNLGVLYKGNTTDFSKVDFNKESLIGKDVRNNLNNIFKKIAVLQEDGTYTFNNDELLSVYTIKQLSYIYTSLKESYLFKEFLYMMYDSYLKEMIENKYPDIKLNITKEGFFHELEIITKTIDEIIKILKDDFGSKKYLTPQEYKAFLTEEYNNIKDTLKLLTIIDVEKLLQDNGLSFNDIDKFANCLLDCVERLKISSFTRIMILVKQGKLAFLDISIDEIYKLGIDMIDILRGLDNYQSIILPNICKYSKLVLENIPKEYLPSDFDPNSFKGTTEEVDKILLDIRNYLLAEIEKNKK